MRLSLSNNIELVYDYFCLLYLKPRWVKGEFATDTSENNLITVKDITIILKGPQKST